MNVATARRVFGLTLLLTRAVCGTNEEGVEFLGENAQREEVVQMPSGLQYEVLKAGPEDGPHPNASSKCLCHYRGTLLNGEEFDSSYKRGTPATFAPNQVVKGWTEALQLMRPGDKWKLYLPSDLAYGDSGAGAKIPAGAMLIFELELIEVQGEGSMVDQVVDMVKQQPMLLLGFVYVIYMLYNQFGGGGPSGMKELPIAEAAAADENVNVFFDMQIGDEEPARIEMQLFAKHYPKTAENFRCLCTGEKGEGLAFKGSSFHRIIPGFMCQGGDFTAGNGTGGKSIYGSKFNDEWDNGYIAHNKPYLLSMANAGPNTNGSQFFLTTASCGHLNGKHVVFGQVTEGADVVKALEKVGSGSGSTSKKVVIHDCGETKSKST